MNGTEGQHMFRTKLVCVCVAVMAFLVAFAPVSASAAGIQNMNEINRDIMAEAAYNGLVADVSADKGTYSTETANEVEYSESETETEVPVDGSSYGKIEQNIIQKNPDIQVKLDYGVDRYAVYDAGCQVMLDIHSDIDMTGYVTVTPSYDESYDDQSVKYSQKIDWDAGSDNELRFYVNELGYGRLLIQIKDESGTVVYSESDMLSVSGYETTITVGVISDAQDAFDNLDDVRVRNQTDSVDVKRLCIRPEAFPDSAQGLDVVNYILIDDFDTSRLSADQMEALQEWVLDGGTLILSLGDNAEKILSGFDTDFINYTLDGKTEKDIDVWLDKDDHLQFKKTTIADISVEGTQTYDALAGAADLDSGFGKVIILPYALSSDSIIKENSKLQLIEHILKIGCTDKINGMVQGAFYDNCLSYGITNAINNNKKKTVSPVILIVILVIYLIVCGPVTYVILKKKHRREWIWIIVPAWAVVGTLAIYIVSTKYRVTKPLELTFTAADISDNIMRQNAYTYIIGSKAGSYSVDVDNKYSNVRVLDNMYMNTSDSQTMDVERIADDSGVKMKFNTHVPFDGLSLEATSVSGNDIGRFGGSLKLYTDGLEGTVENNTSYDMTDVVVMTDGYYFCLDSLSAGASVNITKMQNRRMVKGISYDCMKSYYVSKFGTDYSMDRDADIMMSRNYYMILKMGMYSSAQSDKGRVVMWATVDRNSDVSSNEESEKYGSYIVYDMHMLDYEDVDGAYYSNIYTRDVNRLEQSDYDTNDLMMYSDQVDVDVKFQDCDNIFCLTKQSTGKDAATSNVVVEAYNYGTGEYDTIFANGSLELNGERLKLYLQNSEIRLRFIAPHQGKEYTEIYLPRISARGGGQ